MDALHALSRDDGETYRERPPAENDVSEDGLEVSEEEYWDRYYNHPDFTYEWNNGVLEVRPVADKRGSVTCQWFGQILNCYFQTYQIGAVVNLEIGFRLALPLRTSIRKPDMAVVLDSNPTVMRDDDCNYDGIFDLCVESLSHSSEKEVRRDTVTKKDEYGGAGVREYYILDARGIETAFYRLGRPGLYTRIIPVGGDIIQSGVLPGFQFRVSDLYTRPSLEELAQDGIYHGYVFPSYKEVKLRAEQEKLRAEKAEQEKQQAEKEKQQAEQEKLRAEKEKLRAEKEKLRAEKLLISERQISEQEREKAERLAAKLRLLGIDPDE